MSLEDGEIAKPDSVYQLVHRLRFRLVWSGTYGIIFSTLKEFFLFLYYFDLCPRRSAVAYVSLSGPAVHGWLEQI